MRDECEGDQERREFLARIGQHDYTVVTMREEWARDRSWLALGFVYTVGLWTFHEAPELIVVGAGTRYGVQLAHRYAELVKAGRRFEPGGPYPDLPPGTLLETVAPAFYSQWFARAYDFYPEGDFPALQLLWRDRAGNTSRPVLTESGRPESSRYSA